MTELSFAKSFLSTLDSRAIKLQPDHAADLKTLELKGPYTLPRYPSSPAMQPPSSSTTTQPQPQQSSSSTPSTETITINLMLRSLKPPPFHLSLPALDTATPVLDLKHRVKDALRRDTVTGIKILYLRKPCPDTKTVGEVLGDKSSGGEVEVEFGVLIVGDGDARRGGEGEGEGEGGDADTVMGGEGGRVAGVAQGGRSGEEVLGSAEFWDDLQGWLMQRVRDEGVAGEVWGLFKRGWDER